VNRIDEDGREMAKRKRKGEEKEKAKVEDDIIKQS
jgi:hypothetical protein